MTQEERDFAEQHHDLVIDFLRYRRLPMDEFYDVVIFGYLSAVQQYFRNEKSIGQLRPPQVSVPGGSGASKKFITVKLQISGGNIKAVQGDTGHAQARMVTDLYAHTNTEDRRRLVQKMEQDFFQGSRQPTGDDKAPADDTAQALRLLQENPDMAKLIIAALGRSAGS